MLSRHAVAHSERGGKAQWEIILCCPRLMCVTQMTKTQHGLFFLSPLSLPQSSILQVKKANRSNTDKVAQTCNPVQCLSKETPG